MIFKNKIFWIIVIFILSGFGGYFYYIKTNLDKNNKNTELSKEDHILSEDEIKARYYEIFNSKDILDGDEDTAEKLLKIDKRFNKYRTDFIKITKLEAIEDENQLRALFYLNFIHMFGYYGERDLPAKQDIKHLFFNTEANNCGSYTLMLAMILDKAGYEFRTVSINDGNHGFIEIKFENNWQILDPTTNLWIKKSGNS
jgi:hypothetical protein